MEQDNKWIKVVLHSSAYYLPILLPLLFILLIDDSRVKSLSLQALLFQIVMSILISISVVFSYVLIGIPFLIVFGLMGFIVPIIGIIRALQGEYWNYPIVGRWVK